MKIEISPYDIKNLKPITNSRHKGNFGSCYLFFNKALKYLDMDKEILKKIDIEKRLDELSKIRIDGVSLPINLVYVNDKFTGYTMPYYNGPNLKNILLKYKLGKINITKEDIEKAYNIILNKIQTLSYNKIKINDIKPDNIIYYNGDFKIVDCDFYQVVDDISLDDILKYNLKLLDEAYKKVMKDYFDSYQDDDVIKKEIRM